MNVHQKMPVLYDGVPLKEADAALILLHGRGASAEDILLLADELRLEGFAYLAPQAADHSWYPYRFIEPVERNEPYLSSGLARIHELIKQVEAAGIAPQRIMLLGFSQGACLTLEYAARNPKSYGGVAALSGGLIGSAVSREQYPGTFDKTPVFIGCSDVDFHIPLSRVRESTAILSAMGAQVTERIYPGLGHSVNRDELDFVRGMAAKIKQ